MIIRRPPRIPQPVWLAAGALALVALLAVATGEGDLRFAGVPRVELPLPAGRAPVPALGLPAPADAAPLPAPAAPASVDPRLLEEGAYGPLPRIGPDGRRPLAAYARAFDGTDPRPRVAILLAGLGLRAETTIAALALPAAVSLGFSPYAADLPSLLEQARRAGHEGFLELPLEPADYPDSDPGPKTLLAGLTMEENRDRLLWVLGRAAGYAGLVATGGRFAASPQALPVTQTLAQRGLGLVEAGADGLAEAAVAAGLAYARALPPLDENPAAGAIDDALAGLEAQALESGRALGVAQAYPVTLERLRQWAERLEDKGLVLAPVSALLIEQTGVAAGPPDRRRHAASRG